MQIFDVLTLDSPKRTKDGYLVASAKVARTGVQEYSGTEMGRPQMDVVRVFRPPEEVFATDALRSFAWKPVTNDHPGVAVDSKNWNQYAVGQIGDEVARDGDTIRVPLVLMDETAIADVESGKVELSMGYSVDLRWESGTTAEGLQFDAVQTNIRANHLAVVDKARGGPRLRIGDDDMPQDSAVKIQTITVDGLPIDTTDAGAAAIRKLLTDRETAATATAATVTDLTKKLQDSTAQVATLTAENATLKTNLADATSPAKLDAAVAARADSVAKGKAIIGDKLIVAGKSLGEIRRQVVDAKLGAVATGWTEDQVATSFATLTADVKTPAADPLADAIRGGGGHVVAGPSAGGWTSDAAKKAWDESNAASRDAWKGGKAA